MGIVKPLMRVWIPSASKSRVTSAPNCPSVTFSITYGGVAVTEANKQSIEDLLQQATNNPNLSGQHPVTVPGNLLKSFRKGRDKADMTNLEFITECVTEELPGLFEQLVSAGVLRERNEEETTSFLVDEKVLEALRIAFQTTGIRINLLLLTCIRRKLERSGQSNAGRHKKTVRRKK